MKSGTLPNDTRRLGWIKAVAQPSNDVITACENTCGPDDDGSWAYDVFVMMVVLILFSSAILVRIVQTVESVFFKEMLVFLVSLVWMLKLIPRRVQAATPKKEQPLPL